MDRAGRRGALAAAGLWSACLGSACLGFACLCLCPPGVAASPFSGQTSGQEEQKAGTPAPAAGPNVKRTSPGIAVNLDGLIRLNVVVRDAAGQSVAGLGSDDLTVLDNGQPQKTIAFMPPTGLQATRPEASGPQASVVVLLDTLALPDELASEERQQVLAFLRADDGRLAYPVTVYTLEDTGFFLTAQASRYGNLLAEAVEADKKQDPLFVPPMLNAGFLLRTVDPNFLQFPPGTGMRALATIAAAEDRVPGRKILLWVGPGLRGTGTGVYPDKEYRRLLDLKKKLTEVYTPSDVAKPDVQQDVFGKAYWFLTLWRQAGITLDVFSVGERDWAFRYEEAIPGEKGKGQWMRAVNAWKPFQKPPVAPSQVSWMDLYKKVLALESGGSVLKESDQGIAQQMAECVREASTYYTLTFDPPPAAHPDEYHTIDVKVRQAGLTAKTVRGYYDEPFYNDPAMGRPVTVEQLAGMLRAANGDGEQVRMLAQLMLTERPTDEELAKLQSEVHGGKAREALELVVDTAAFRPPAKSEVLPDAPPSAAEQQQMLDGVLAYLQQTIPRLPNFFAIRQSLRLDSNPPYHEVSTKITGVPLHQSAVSKANVLYRQGQELLNGRSGVEVKPGGQALFTYGTFGPMLKTARAALVYGKGVSWSRWERGVTGREAVFRFAVPATGPNEYTVTGCCIPDHAEDTWFQVFPAYHGEVAIDPATGSILRITLEADLVNFVPVEESDISVEYAPLTLELHTYFVPKRSVSLWRGRSLPIIGEWDASFSTWGPEETRINVFSFDHYHVFHGSVRMLPGFEPLEKLPK